MSSENMPTEAPAPRTPVYANWATSPLLPRKSPDRFNRRLALGHKTTQSLNIPRVTDVAATLEALLKPIKPTTLTIDTQNTAHPAVLSPKPKRPQDLTRTLEASPPPQTRQEQAPQQAWKLDSPKGKRHVRGARSMSPQRTQQLFNPQDFVTASEHDALHQRRPIAMPVPSVEAVLEELQTFALTDPLFVSTETVHVPSEEEAIQLLINSKQVAMNGEVNPKVTWAEQVLRLTDRHRLRQATLTGNPTAPLPLLLYELEQEALDAVKSATSQHATFLLGLLHEFGKNGVSLDRQEAFRRFKQAAAEGYPRADYRLGMQFEKVGDMQRACACYERGAARDDAACLYRLGMMLIFGQHGYTLDKEKGVSCLHLSALGADTDAPLGALVFGLLLAKETKFKIDSSILQPDEGEALAFIQKAAKLGSPGAQVRLGKAYERNELGLPFSPRLSLHYHQLGALGGDPEADLALSKWYLAGSDDGAVMKDEGKAFLHSKLAAMRGLPAAEFGLGYLYEIGVGCSADLLEARMWYARAAGHGDADAVARLESLSRQRTLSRRDHDRNIAVQITARHATLKLNSQAAAERRRQRSMMPSTSALQVSDISSGVRLQHRSTPSLLSPPRRAPPIPQLTQTEIADCLAPPRSPQRHQASTPLSPTKLGRLLETPPLHRRGQSWAPQGSPVLPSDTATSRASPFYVALSTSPRQANQGHAHAQSLVGPVYPPLAEEGFLQTTPPVDRRTHAAVTSWNLSARALEQVVQIPHGPEESPVTAPASEVGSTLEAVMAARGSPRPESSVSNIIPREDRPSTGLLGDEAMPARRGFALSDVGATPDSPGLQQQQSLSVMSSSPATAAAGVKRGGPATFEEMGIPLENKKDADCIVM
ncbi:hypothetical protein BCR37DRAFT_381647 [Protomyces lactucae-debilis]|uniref:HCP-like protein n=1 Tax=Protomyces lactucae-debilis TaxID=2754530 RepID=A0A1Y2F6F5_PROLT|nr:uncharacterized protein BCR37DRAFT_381647 [Protomyces lactucae-debilis]ORY79463.1 hypothetical protein BCR37DRAFT_381647 [Protomyces lactucae-debilis]